MSYYIVLESSVDESFHVTLLPAFSFDEERYSLKSFIHDVEIALSDFRFKDGFSVVGNSEEVFTSSDNESVPVLTVKNAVLMEVHYALVSVAFLYDVCFVNDSFVGDGYSPHISGADLTTVIPVFDSVSLSRFVDEGFESVVLNIL